MKARHAILVVLAAAFTLTSIAAAGPDAAKQRVSITFPKAKASPVSRFVLTPLLTGPIKQDSGTATAVWGPGRDVMREVQKISIAEDITTYKGKRGSLTIRERSEWVDVSNENAPGFDFRPGVAMGTWKVVRGTGQYTGVTGGGRSAHAGMGQEWFARQEGFLTGS